MVKDLIEKRTHYSNIVDNNWDDLDKSLGIRIKDILVYKYIGISIVVVRFILDVIFDIKLTRLGLIGGYVYAHAIYKGHMEYISHLEDKIDFLYKHVKGPILDSAVGK